VLAEEQALALGGASVLYVATALASRDPEMKQRVRIHRQRRPAGWGTFELGGGDLERILDAAERWRAVLLDSLTLWVSARMLEGEGEEATLEQFDRFLKGAAVLATPLVLVSDEVGFGVVPDSGAGRRFRDTLGLANQRAAAVAEEVLLCFAGVGVRIK
jgi:adenosylcobinamide kinase / adenosylcobinamide-phosphate guanylyltransferase